MSGLLVVAGSGLTAEVTSPAPEATAVVVYPGEAWGPSSGLAMLSETRTVDLPAGPSTIRLRGVADTLAPQTVEVEGLPAPVAERDFDYDLLSPGALLKRGIDQRVQLVRTNPRTGQATVRPAVIRSAPDGVALEVDGRIEALHCSGAPERIVFDRAPAGLSDKPTLSVRTVVPRAGSYRLTVRYLATGFGWRADYVARVRPEGGAVDLTGWLTLQNRSGAGFKDAPTEVVAGRLGLTGEDQSLDAPVVRSRPDCWSAESWAKRMRGAGPPPPPAPPPPPPPAMEAPAPASRVEELIVTSARRMAKQTELGDYKLYTLPEPTTVAARQTKQVRFLERAAVPFETVHAYDLATIGEDAPQTATRIELHLANKPERGLGLPLPQGSAAVSAPGPGGRALLVGQARVEDTPVGLPWVLKLGTSRQVQVAPRRVPASAGAVEIEAMVANALPEPATVAIRAEAGWKVASESAPHGLYAGRPEWTLRLAPHGRQVLRYRLIPN